MTTGESAAVAAPGDVVTAIKKFVAREGGRPPRSFRRSAPPAYESPSWEARAASSVTGLSPTSPPRRPSSMQYPGLSVGEWERTLVSATTVKPSHYRKMAGWVARQSRFPKARNRAAL